MARKTLSSRQENEEGEECTAPAKKKESEEEAEMVLGVKEMKTSPFFCRRISTFKFQRNYGLPISRKLS
jgi:hypothetical protein